MVSFFGETSLRALNGSLDGLRLSAIVFSGALTVRLIRHATISLSLCHAQELSMKKRAAKSRRKKAKKKAEPAPGPPEEVPPVEGRAHIDVQTDNYLEELTDKLPVRILNLSSWMLTNNASVVHGASKWTFLDLSIDIYLSIGSSESCLSSTFGTQPVTQPFNVASLHRRKMVRHRLTSGWIFRSFRCLFPRRLEMISQLKSKRAICLILTLRYVHCPTFTLLLLCKCFPCMLHFWGFARGQ